jgi:complement component 1 Q subcomponent-binding protein
MSHVLMTSSSQSHSLFCRIPPGSAFVISSIHRLYLYLHHSRLHTCTVHVPKNTTLPTSKVVYVAVLYPKTKYKMMKVTSISANLFRRGVRGSLTRFVSQSPIMTMTARATPPLVSPRYFSSAADELKDILERERDEEIENETPPQELLELRATVENDWKIVEPDNASFKLVKKGSPKVSLSVHCQDYLDEMEHGMDGGDGGEDEGEDFVPPLRFTAIVTKAGKSLVFQCLSENGMPRIEAVGVTKDSVDNILANGVDKMQYQGPEFTELAEDLQDKFLEYLQDDCGVNEDVATFLAMFADFKEEKSYVVFLEDAKTVL